MSTENQEKWIKLTPSSHNVKAVVNINAREFVTSSTPSLVLLQKYNITNNKFTNLADIKNDTVHRIAYNQETHDIYIHDAGNELHTINVNTKQHNMLNNAPKTNSQTYFVSINNILHFINNHDKHYFGSIQNMKLKCLHNSLENSDVWTCVGGQIIYIPSIQSILLISGFEKR
eukprot:232549_1